MTDVKPKVLYQLRSILGRFAPLNVNVELTGLYILDHQRMEDVKTFTSKDQVIMAGHLEEYYQNLITIIDRKTEEFAEKDYGMFQR